MANCEYCGSPLTPGAKFCTNCGHSIPAPAETSYETIPTMGGSDVIIEPPRKQGSPAAEPMEVEQRLVGTKVEYYLPKFGRFRSEGGVASFNWPAFFFGPYWMAYRKMYVLAVVVMLISDVAVILNSGLINLLLMIGCSVLGNFLYMKDIEHRTQKVLDLEPEKRDAYIERNGGASFVPVVLLVVLTGILGMLFG